MVLYQNKRAIGIFTNPEAVRQALEELQQAQFPLHRITVIARELEEEQTRNTQRRNRTGNHGGEGAAKGSIIGGAIGLLTGLLVGVGALAVPLIGPIMLADALGTAVATTLAGTGIGAVSGGLLGVLIGLGIPEKQAQAYHDRLLRGDHLILVEGTEPEIRHAISILQHRGMQEWGIYNAPDLEPANTDFPVAAVADPHHQFSHQGVYRNSELN
ncbi:MULTISPECIES: general stress protein [unclassified Coleofasciculus]|uniref:general stress protein n=1 Tax=unclassified Coleofasciculus TaxID=2692782 RepID=UPI00187FBE22|nr:MULTISPECIES: general stress protein [unclassified Coleofasciculus]MBE9127496.1 DUF1269 domain-containing protein [Coleofasciculus sp. LEGE 07081]MBE9150842.1 DUF1269 domain-containing protein [Coleofasciculus sp. LEGE 07092]